MERANSRTILIAGAGIAGLTAGLAFARHGFGVRIFERAERLEEVGAGLQLSPNATRILHRLGVLEGLRTVAVAPEAVVLIDAASLGERARVPLGKPAEQRWGAPYLVAHRADLQQALLSAASAEPGIECFTGADVCDVVFAGARVEAHLSPAATAALPRPGVERGALLVGADGVWSKVRHAAGLGASRFTGHVAWRVTVPADMPEAARVVRSDVVSAFLHPGVHLVAYPIRAGAEINLVAIHKGGGLAESWQNDADPGALFAAFRGAHPDLVSLVRAAGRWLAWPLHGATLPRWTHRGGLALIGDAAHAMTPFAAQGAAMAIEDAAVLAELAGASPKDIPGALARYEAERRPRVARAARRGALNHLAWQASGPVAVARNLVLKLRPAQSLMAELDWLYGWDREG